VHQILINEKYVGNNVWNHFSNKLKMKRVRNMPEQWIRSDAVFQPIVSHLQFKAAQEVIQARSYRVPDEEMLSILKALYAQTGYLSGLIIDEAEECPSSSAYQYRFGSLLRTYSMIGYTPTRDYQYIDANRQLRLMYPLIVKATMEKIIGVGGRVNIDPVTDLMQLNSELIVSLVLCRCQLSNGGLKRWKVRFDFGLNPDITIAVRMMPGEEGAQDYYILPTIDMNVSDLRLAETNQSSIDIYRFETLDILAELSRRTPYRRAA
jgi:hypothetical protein